MCSRYKYDRYGKWNLIDLLPSIRAMTNNDRQFFQMHPQRPNNPVRSPQFQPRSLIDYNIAIIIRRCHIKLHDLCQKTQAVGFANWSLKRESHGLINLFKTKGQEAQQIHKIRPRREIGIWCSTSRQEASRSVAHRSRERTLHSSTVSLLPQPKIWRHVWVEAPSCFRSPGGFNPFENYLVLVK